MDNVKATLAKDIFTDDVIVEDDVPVRTVKDYDNEELAQEFAQGRFYFMHKDLNNLSEEDQLLLLSYKNVLRRLSDIGYTPERCPLLNPEPLISEVKRFLQHDRQLSADVSRTPTAYEKFWRERDKKQK
ncbi:MAG: hypothetical protein FWF34_02485 [Alphaproteobacteria bacterium]|nr:hypothetical protein [Alphaproteobacteria bacterium]MCL2890098.1 hypothetical protein [Alphaproteobacteria bacterium]